MLTQKGFINKEFKKDRLFVLAGLIVVKAVGCAAARGFGKNISTVANSIMRN
ncbi:MAG: hypothetical protein PHV17_04350 [Candidatus Omnitrophica bacterium]|nr:hypothetical protein [Candidatus Omnitrophota bacterium]